MKDFHLLGEELLQPFVLLHIVVDELDGQGPRYLDGTLPFLASVEPGFCPPYDAVSVGIDADCALDVEALDVNLKISKRVDDALTFYSPVSSFFFSISLIDDRNTLCIMAR